MKPFLSIKDFITKIKIQFFSIFVSNKYNFIRIDFILWEKKIFKKNFGFRYFGFF